MLIRTEPVGGWGASGAASEQQLLAGQDGWFEVTVSETNTYRMIGFSDANTNADYTSIDYALYMNLNGLYVYENSVNKGSFGAINAGDILKAERMVHL